jgi:hypothetical protein
MNEDSARAVTLLQAFESAQPSPANWGDDDRAWATRLALQDAPASAEAFVVRRAHHAMQRLAPREPAAAAWLARRLWEWRWIGWVAFGAGLLGLLADSIGSSQHINLLAPPLWAVLAWNALVYAVLLGHALARLLLRPSRPGTLQRLAQRALRLGRRMPGAGAAAGGSARALQAFAALWLRRSAPLSGARATMLLHAASAALALGLIAGLYLRGLVLDYRVAWESTFLGAATAHDALALLLAPAVALSGIALPDAVAFEAMRAVHGAAAAGAPAAPWIHLLALTLALFVVLPRSALALAAALRAQWLARRFVLPANDPYFERLARQRRGDVPQVAVLPYASTPLPQAVLGLQALLAPALGDGMELRVLPTTAFGAEDDAAAPTVPMPGTTLAIALFDLAATPEAESQGRFALQLARGAPAGATTILLVDEAGFRERFGTDSARLAQRRDAWCAFGERLGTLPVFVDLAAPDIAAAPRALELAMRRPVARGDA